METKTEEKKEGRSEKGFDTVEFFRKEKERIARETEGMSFEEFKAYLKEQGKWFKKK